MNIRQAINTARTEWSKTGMVPARLWLVAAALLLGGLWMREHDAQVREKASLEQTRQATRSSVQSLKTQADAAIRAANQQNAQAVRGLEAERQKLQQRASQLASEIASLHASEQAQVERVATLPTSNVVNQVVARLGLEKSDLYSPPVQSSMREFHQGPPLAQKPESEVSSQKSEVKSSVGLQSDTKPALTLSDSGARKVETAFVELDSCRAQSVVKDQQVSNCAERTRTDAATISKQADSIAELNQALAAQDKILAERQAEAQAELRAARGTFLGRLARTTEHVAIGVGIGVAIGIAAH